jgi:hypothetical protein
MIIIITTNNTSLENFTPTSHARTFFVFLFFLKSRGKGKSARRTVNAGGLSMAYLSALYEWIYAAERNHTPTWTLLVVNISAQKKSALFLVPRVLSTVFYGYILSV